MEEIREKVNGNRRNKCCPVPVGGPMSLNSPEPPIPVGYGFAVPIYKLKTAQNPILSLKCGKNSLCSIKAGKSQIS
jgi:hypothetical protein